MQPLTRVTRACRKYDAARDERVASMRAAKEAGHSLRAIASAAGVSHVAVLKMLRVYPEGGAHDGTNSRLDPLSHIGPEPAAAVEQHRVLLAHLVVTLH